MTRLAPLVSVLGVAQIISWGTLFYAISVLAPAMGAELGASQLYVFGSFTAGLIVSGTLAPAMGRLIDRRGGRLVLSIGSLLGAAAMLLLALAPNPAVMTLGWLTAGAAMAACLYDPAFAALSQIVGDHYRRAVTALTLFGGFASTAFWPLSLLLLEAYGWRGAFAIYAALHLLICLPIHALLVPRHVAQIRAAAAPKETVRTPEGNASLNWLTLSFAIATFVFGVVAVHMISLLTSGGLTAAQAVTISMLAGPLQVAGRIIEFGFARRVRATSVGFVAFALMLVSLFALLNINAMGAAAIAFVTAYGFSNGVLTIVKGTAPAELFGREGFGALLGRMARAGLYAKAIAPASYSAILAAGITRSAALAILIGLAVLAVAAYFAALRTRPA